MPKTIDYPRTTYASAWEVAEVVDDTGGKCAVETCAKKLDRKVSGSFKAIIGSAVKFGLLTSKREILTTTNLFRRIKHAYDKQEEKIFHREAFLHPPLFLQICRKFRNRELPVHMFDIMLIREFDVEEINAQSVAKAFVEGARAVDVLDERNVVADIDQLAAQQAPRRELASQEMPPNLFGQNPGARKTPATPPTPTPAAAAVIPAPAAAADYTNSLPAGEPVVPPLRGKDAVSSLFGLDTDDLEETSNTPTPIVVPRSLSSLPATPTVVPSRPPAEATSPTPSPAPAANNRVAEQPEKQFMPALSRPGSPETASTSYSLYLSGPGIESQLVIQDVHDLEIASILLEKIRKQLSK